MPELRLLAALHHLVLRGAAPELARFYPSAGGDQPPSGAWAVARETIAGNEAFIRDRARRTVQTNEPGRCVALYGGLLWLAERHRLPIRLLEIGASAGLNLNADRFAYVVGGVTLGDAASPLTFTEPWDGIPVRRPGRRGGAVAGRRPRRLRPVAAGPLVAGRAADAAVLHLARRARAACPRRAGGAGRRAPSGARASSAARRPGSRPGSRTPGRTCSPSCGSPSSTSTSTTPSAPRSAARSRAPARQPLAWLTLEPPASRGRQRQLRAALPRAAGGQRQRRGRRHRPRRVPRPAGGVAVAGRFVVGCQRGCYSALAGPPSRVYGVDEGGVRPPAPRPLRRSHWQLSAAGFRGSTQQLLRLIGWLDPVERLAGAAVGLGGDRVWVGLGVKGEVRAFGRYRRSSPLVFSLEPRCE